MYVELHSRSAFSFLEGAASPEELIAVSAELGMPAMALLDRDGVYGAPRFHMAAMKAEIRAHIGAEVTSVEGFRYPLLVRTRAGYQNLCRLITRMKLRAKKGEGAVTEEEMAEHAEGLVCLAGHVAGDVAPSFCPAPVPGAAAGAHRAPLQNISRLTGIFGRENVYVELQRHFDRQEEARNQAAVEIARKLRLPILATNGVCYAMRCQREILDVFTSIRHHRTLDTAGRLLSRNSERYVKTPKEMARLFADLPEAIANTAELSSRLEFALNDLGYEFPRYPVPEGDTEMSFLRKRALEGMIHRYGTDNARARAQVERELAMIEKLKLAGYFLIVWDIVCFCRDHNILVQGRGSAANSAVCYSLGITAVDPVGMDLLFERFLSEERGEWPDIDMDLPSGDQRERAIQYVYERYGKLGAAMTANVITYRGKSAAREVGKVLGFDRETLDRLTSLVSAWEYQDPTDTLQRHFLDAGFDLAQPRIRKFLELCMAIQDLPRHLGQHSGGMVVCQGQLDSVVPLEPATMPGRVVVQWDKEDCADMGIIKVDLLGLGMMAVLEDTIRLVRESYGEEVDLAHLPQDDDAVYKALQQADTVGMFQVESRAQMSCLPRLRPEHFYDVVVEVAIIRPGPIVGNMVHPYLKRRQGREPVEYPHPSLEPVLKRTLGVPLFQEQLLRMAMIAADFTGGEAEELRRAMGFKRSEARMKGIESKLRAGMERKGIVGEAQEEIIKSITSFALYGFPESHAASFALIAYASAYLKCHYLAAFTAALLNNQPMGFYHPATLVKDAQRHGLRVKPIDITQSDWPCTLEVAQGPISDPAVCNGIGQAAGPQIGPRATVSMRVGLKYVKGLREETARALIRERARLPFTSVNDLVRRVPELRKSELVTLAEVGALNWVDPALLPPHPPLRGTLFPQGGEGCYPMRGNGHQAPLQMHRRDALWQVERATRPAGPLLEDRDQSSEFAISSDTPLAPMTPDERLVADFRVSGMTVGPHPMSYRRVEMKKLGVRAAADLLSIPSGRFVRVAGCVIARQRPGTAKGFVFLSLEDETGIANAIIMPDLFERHRLAVVRSQFLIVEGRLQKQDGVISVKAERVRPLEVTRAETRSHDFH